MTDAEFEPSPGIPQYQFLNKHREYLEIAHRSDTKLAELFEKGIAGFRWLCFDKECKGEDCDAFIHPDWSQDLVVDMSRRQNTCENVKMEFPGPVASRNIPRPISKDTFDTEVRKRVQEFREIVEKHDYSHTVYTILTTDDVLFSPTLSAETICRGIIERKDDQDDQGAIPVYTGVNDEECAARNHSYETSSSVYESVQTGRTALQIATQTFSSRNQARKEEALRLVTNNLIAYTFSLFMKH